MSGPCDIDRESSSLLLRDRVIGTLYADGRPVVLVRYAHEPLVVAQARWAAQIQAAIAERPSDPPLVRAAPSDVAFLRVWGWMLATAAAIFGALALFGGGT